MNQDVVHMFSSIYHRIKTLNLFSLLSELRVSIRKVFFESLESNPKTLPSIII